MTPVFLPRYLEPRKVPTNPRWCPYAKGSPHEGHAPRSSNSVESCEPSPHTSGAPLLAPLRRPSRLHYRASGRNAMGLVPSSTGSRDTNRLSRSLNTLVPLGTITTAHATAKGLCVFSKLTQLTRIHLEQVLMWSN
jgi:hypothetical protein